ncbi:MAG TPA: beta-galactosidase [Armatimonadota bacterium]|jgi:hypothetical protein
MKTRTTLSLLMIILLLCVGAHAATALQDTLTFTAFDAETLLSTKGWKTTLARNGGWGQFPAHYTYQVLEVDGKRCVVDSYLHAQNHGNATAIPLDWDGNPANGQTPLTVTPGMTVTFQVSAYLQPYSPGWSIDGTGNMVWSFGPGLFDPKAEAVTEPKAVEAYNWTAGRGPRVQYRQGYSIDGKEVTLPQLRAFAPENAAPAVDGKTLPTKRWMELRLSMTFTTDLTQASAVLQTRAAGADAWSEQGRWSFPIDLTAQNASNPARWNALLLDEQLANWAKKGYGQSTPEMRDRFDRFTVEVTPAGATGNPAHGTLLMGERPPVAVKLQGQTTLFADDAPTWTLTLANGNDAALDGTLLARSDAAPARVITVAPCHVAGQGNAAFTLRPQGLLIPGAQKVQLLLRDGAGREQLLSEQSATLLPQLRPVPGVNLLRNASFELGEHFNGTPMRQGAEFYQMFVKEKEISRWSLFGAEGWWAEGGSVAGISVSTAQAHSGKSSLCVSGAAGQARAVISAFDRLVTAGPVTLSAWVKSEGGSGRLDLDIIGDWGASPSVRKSLPLAATTGWQRVTITADAPSQLSARARLQVDGGTVYLDDVQIEAGATASAFNLRPEEWLRLAVNAPTADVLPKWLAGDTATRTVSVTNDSRVPVTGTVRLATGPWTEPAKDTIASFNAATLAPGASKAVTFATGALAPNAYLVCLTLTRDGVAVADGVRDFAVTEGIGGVASNGMLRARTAARFAIVPNTPPAQIFGIGNSMLDTEAGSWFGGWTLAGYSHARPLGLTGVRSNATDENTYLAAVAATPIHVMGLRADTGVPAGATFANPAFPEAIDIYNPQGWKYFIQRAEETGKQYGANPMIASYQMSNEAPYLNIGRLCPSPYADADFRAWAQKRYGGLDALNARWHSNYTDWAQVEQISSARFAEAVKNIPKKEGAAAIDWMANTGTYSAEVRKRMQDNPGQAMDWLRWRTDSSVRMYTAFRAAARKYDSKTLYGTNLCWPGFWPQMFMPFLREMDNVQLDIQYTSGQQRALGTPSEMMDSMEMAESTQPGKPVWGIEVYHQPQWPAEYIAFQGWGTLAHGMTNDLTFAWHPYSDAGPVKGTHAWEKADASPMWFVIDTDGTKLPAYTSYTRSVDEVRAYHQRYNGLTIKRAPTTVAFYVSPDTAEYVVYETGNQPWNSYWQRTRNALIYALRLNGVTVQYVDDATLPAAPGAFTTVIVPAAYVLNQQAAAKLAGFAKAGGAVVLAGMTGVVDPWLTKYDNIGGPAWAELGWKAPDFYGEMADVTFAANTEKTSYFRGRSLGRMPDAQSITDTRANTVGFVRAWGKGRLIAYGILPDSYNTDPHLPANLQAWTAQLMTLAKLPITGRWAPNTDTVTPGAVGTGSPVVEIVVRQKSANEKFVFCLNQGGAGDGNAEITVTPGAWTAEDAITGKPIPGGTVAGDTWRLPLHLEAYGYRVIRLLKR